MLSVQHKNISRPICFIAKLFLLVQNFFSFDIALYQQRNNTIQSFCDRFNCFIKLQQLTVFLFWSHFIFYHSTQFFFHSHCFPVSLELCRISSSNSSPCIKPVYICSPVEGAASSWTRVVAPVTCGCDWEGFYYKASWQTSLAGMKSSLYKLVQAQTRSVVAPVCRSRCLLSEC